MKKLYNHLRNAACVVLFFTALFLIYQIWSSAMGTTELELFRYAFSGKNTEEQFYPGYAEQSWALDVITPLSCSVRAGNGVGLYGTANRETASVCFEKVSAVLAEALETAGEPEKVSDEIWQEALSGTMVYMRFGGNIPIATLARILGAEMSEAQSDAAESLVLAVSETSENGEISVLYQNEAGEVFRMDTSAGAQFLISVCSETEPNGYCFSHELGTGKTHETILLQPEASVQELTTVSVLESSAETDANRFIEGILESFEFNAYMPHSYRESDGTQVYVDEERILRVGVDGWVSYYDPAADRNVSYEPNTGEKAARIAEAAKIASEAEASFIGDARLYLMDAVYDEESGLYTVRFGAESNGIPILNDRGYSVRVEIRGTETVAVDFLLRSFHNTGGSIAVLPAVQAAAAAMDKQGFGLYYVLNESTISAGWYESGSVK